MSEEESPEYKALFNENAANIESKMTGLFYQPDPGVDNKWANLTIENLENSVRSMNEEYLRKVLLGDASEEEKKYLSKLEAELARRKKAEAKGFEPPKPPSLFGD